MSEFCCKKCGKEFKRNYELNRHINRITSCVGGSKTSRRIKYHCNYCHRKFNRKDSLTRHLKNCNDKINIHKLKGKSNALAYTNVNGNDNTTTLANFIKSPIYINLIIYAKDGIKNLSYDELNNVLGSNENLVQALTKTVNLNPNKPQHHNIYYSDMKSSYGEVYENKKWVRKKIDEILETLIDAKLEDLNEILNDMNDFLNKKTRNKIKETIERFDCTKPDYRKKLKTYLRPILYNHKDMIIKTRKLTKKQEDELIRREQAEVELELANRTNKK